MRSKTLYEEDSKMDKLRLGIIGIGNMGSGHLGYVLDGECPSAKLCHSLTFKLIYILSLISDRFLEDRKKTQTIIRQS